MSPWIAVGNFLIIFKKAFLKIRRLIGPREVMAFETILLGVLRN